MLTMGRARRFFTVMSWWPLTAAVAAATAAAMHSAQAPYPAAAALLKTCIICTAGMMQSATGPRPRGADYGGGPSRCENTDPVS